MTDPEPAALLSDLAAWSEDARSFHGDRNLADRVLLATDWRCVADPGHPAGAKWEFGTNPVCTIWEPHHPHPVNSIDDAIGQLPFGWRVWQMVQPNRDGEWQVQAVRDGASVHGFHTSLPVAVSIAAVKAWAKS